MGLSLSSFVSRAFFFPEAVHALQCSTARERTRSSFRHPGSRMVNTELLVKHCGQYKMNKDTAAELYRQLFTLHPETAQYYDAEDLDPDMVAKAQKFVMYGQSEMRYFFQLPQAFGQDAKWRTSLASFKEQFSDVGFPLQEFNKEFDAFLKAMEKHAGGVSAEQKSNWMELLNRAYDDMKAWNWF